MCGDVAKIASYYQAGGDLLSGASKFSSQWQSNVKSYGNGLGLNRA